MCPRRTPSQKKMAEGGYDAEIEPLLPHQDDDDDDDEQEVDRTHPFQPGFAPTPCPGGEEIEMQTQLRETSRLPGTSYAETSFGGIPSVEGFIHEDDKPALLDRAKEFIKKRFPKVYFAKLHPIGFSKSLEMR